MKFQPGNKFGRGRPRGSRNKATLVKENLLDQYAEPLQRRAIAEALKGDMPMLRTLLAYLLPRAKELPVKIDPLPTDTIEQLGQSSNTILQKVASGKLTATRALQLSALLEERRRVLETEEHEARLRALEELFKLPKAA